MNYIEDVVDRLALRLPDCERDLLHLYALLVLTRGVSTTSQDVHDAWCCWRTQTMPSHRSIVPFAALAPQVRALDEPYVAAIVAVRCEIGD